VVKRRFKVSIRIVAAKAKATASKIHWTIDKIGAIIVFVGCLICVIIGIDGEIKSILTLSAGWLGGTSYVDMRR